MRKTGRVIVAKRIRLRGIWLGDRAARIADDNFTGWTHGPSRGGHRYVREYAPELEDVILTGGQP